ncbi:MULTISPECIES: glucose-6-phosphate isomerase [unclassified Marinimicrobium]|jgi:glucose-6-phosphate isomerase|uniref:glucose-6-phosphate isomerase n=1 Tax=unclassified Marinimicrobium TaxID=2632100 RepID=UPI000C3C0EE6|nr:MULTISPECIES: glucose-6-phosphate isomerase [unclassified Marinimicrobium]MAN51785.1 glucose-6-phosphate isomerase [Marinimicrobium sp.]|tara:strand:+ start:472 stop:2115 length:1644 start_codon:yes stop_codon:yes gene_type:complete
MASPTQLPSWQSLAQHADTLRQRELKSLFAEDQSRFDNFSIRAPHILFDYSKNLITEETRKGLLTLAEESKVADWRNRMFGGEHINRTEDRAVMHVALRDKSGKPIMVDGKDVRPQVERELNHMRELVTSVRSGEWKGFSGKSITDIVSIGIGGSNLGPLMVTEALSAYSDDTLRTHYVSNVDGFQIAQVLERVNPETTLFIVASKTFTTLETITNANTARAWFLKGGGSESTTSQHFVAVSSNVKKAVEFGVAEKNIFEMWDWVGGRFSLWSTIGLPIALQQGFDAFEELLQGAYEMDRHFCEAPLAENAPVMLALVGIWNRNFLGYPSHALLPYDQCLHRFPAYMQQAEMESNGKSVNWEGETLTYGSVPLIWGEVGINGQHAFYQFLHQGTDIIPADFIGSVKPTIEVEGHHDALMANMFAQTEALMKGIDADQVRADLKAKGMDEARIEEIVAHKVHRGNRPTNTLLMDKVTPRSLGALIALYEHKIFTQGIIWQIHSFDQWGVELGKVLAAGIQPELADGAEVSDKHDASTRSLINYYKQAK